MPDYSPTPILPYSLDLLTVGHSNHTLEAFFDLLQANGVGLLVDVRSQPYSRYSPHFQRDSLRHALESAGIEYLFLGRELGGRPESRELYDAEGHVRYDLLSQSPLFLDGITRLLETMQAPPLLGAERPSAAMMCSEEDPNQCHRRLLIAPVLKQRGIALAHIRGDGRLQPEEELEQAEAQDQLALFDDPKPWRSPKPIL